MATVTFSTLEYLSGLQHLNLMRQYAKKRKKADAAGNALAWHQDQIAISLGFKNWSLLHKHLAPVKWPWQDHVLDLALKKPGLGQFIEDHAVKTIGEDEAIETMEDWARRKYTPLIEFAFYDNESENGFSWPSVEMAEELSSEFAGQYPDDLIEKVGNDLDVDEGPWGLDDRDGVDDDFDEAPEVTT